MERLGAGIVYAGVRRVSDTEGNEVMHIERSTRGFDPAQEWVRVYIDTLVSAELRHNSAAGGVCARSLADSCVLGRGFEPAVRAKKRGSARLDRAGRVTVRRPPGLSAA